MKNRRIYNCSLWPIRASSECTGTHMVMLLFFYRPSSKFEMEGQRFLTDAKTILSDPDNFYMDGACKIWRGTVDYKANGLGYGIVYLRPAHERKKKKFYTHRLAVNIKFNCLNIPKSHEVSHLCHKSLCIEMSHLSVEPHHINNNRIHCKTFNKCTGHAPFADCLVDR